MKVQLGLVLSFLTISVVLAQISFAYPDPDRHERNRCRPPNCTPQRREPGKKISEKDEVPVEGNSLDQSSTTENTNTRNVTDGNETKFENIKTENVTEKAEPSPSPSSTPGGTQNTVSSTTPSANSVNGTDGNSTKSESDPLQIPSETSNDALATQDMGNTTEIQIPVEVKIIPPNGDELRGLTGNCPKEFRYHNESGMCFIPGEGKENACGPLMQFNEEPGSEIYGQCDCKVYDGCDFRPLLYYPQEKRCFHLFAQGPCKSDEWLVPGEKSYEAKCSNRTCPVEENENKLTWFTLNGTCYQTSSTAFCKNPLETAQYEEGKLVPTCSLIPIKVLSPGCVNIKKTITLGAVSLPCGPGKKSTGSGSCGSIVEF